MALALVGLGFLFRDVRQETPSGTRVYAFEWGSLQEVRVDFNGDGVLDFQGRYQGWSIDRSSHDPLATAVASSRCDGVFDVEIEFSASGRPVSIRFEEDAEGTKVYGPAEGFEVMARRCEVWRSWVPQSAALAALAAGRNHPGDLPSAEGAGPESGAGLRSLLPLLVNRACWPSDRSQEMVDLRRSDDCVLVVFHEWVGPDEIGSFFRAHVHAQGSSLERGWYFRSGLISLIRRSADPESYEICFSPGSSEGLREQIRTEFAAAPEVRRVETVQIEPLE